MRVRFLLWGPLRIAAGTAEAVMDLPEGTGVEEAVDAFYAARPALLPHRRATRVAVGNEYAPKGQTLREGDEISLIPPVQGG
jgi:molybdopterin converting factor small subunit